MYTIDLEKLSKTDWVEPKTDRIKSSARPVHYLGFYLNLLQILRQWIDRIEIRHPSKARFFCKLIPAQCPFEQEIWLFGRRIAHIPPLCKLNPFYEQLVGLRFRALSYLADQCGEDVRSYC
ncbi:MAG TPA: nitrogenase [Cyanobacteria bacterium UBA11162]|nr:nitrogenase [Cyanobacteria bacterium UBA11162]